MSQHEDPPTKLQKMERTSLNEKLPSVVTENDTEKIQKMERTNLIEKIPSVVTENDTEKIQKMERTNLDEKIPSVVIDAVLVASEPMPEDAEKVRGYDFNKGVNYHKLLQSYRTSGFQAACFGAAVDEVNKMLSKKGEPIAEDKQNDINMNPSGRELTNCTIFLAFTSNLMSSGLREIFKYLAQHNMVDVITTSAGVIEEDFIKCLGDTYVSDFKFKGKELRMKGMNRIGNLIVPNENYCKFEDWTIYGQAARMRFTTQGVTNFKMATFNN